MPIETSPKHLEDPPSENSDQSSSWVSIARLSNLAEAGYFESILTAAEIGSRSFEHDEFDAISGCWQTAYILQVHESDSAAAVEQIAQEVDRSLEPQAPFSPDVDPSSPEARHLGQHDIQELLRYAAGPDQRPYAAEGRMSTALDVGSESNSPPEGNRPVIWAPVGLMLLAGGLLFGIQRAGVLLIGGGDPPAPKGTTLWEAIRESPLPLYTQQKPGQPSRVIRWDPLDERIQVLDDTDGNGKYDRAREFTAQGLAAEPR
jgi:hypothetical protein